MSTLKLCPECSTLKPTTEFHRNGNARDGHWTRCKECVTKSLEYRRLMART